MRGGGPPSLPGRTTPPLLASPTEGRSPIAPQSSSQRLLSNFLLFVCQAPEHHARHGSVEQHLAGLDEALEVAAHAPVSPDPGECPLHHPAPLEHAKAAWDLWRRLVGAAPDAA